MSIFNNSLGITFSVQNHNLLDARFYWEVLSCVYAGADCSSERLLKAWYEVEHSDSGKNNSIRFDSTI